MLAGLSGCISTSADDTGRYTAPIGGSPVIGNETPYSAALRCFSHYTAGHPLRIAVGQIADYTGKYESDNSGRKLTQGAALMAMSALSKAGVPMVERFDTSVAEMELKYANNKLIGDDKPGRNRTPRKAATTARSSRVRSRVRTTTSSAASPSSTSTSARKARTSTAARPRPTAPRAPRAATSTS